MLFRSKKYTNQRRAAKTPRFCVGDWVRVKRPGKVPKGEPTFGPPQRIIKRVGRWMFQLEGGRVWNASKFTAAPKTNQKSQRQNTSNPFKSSRFSKVTVSPASVSHRHHNWQPQQPRWNGQQQTGSLMPVCSLALDSPPRKGVSNAHPTPMPLRRSGHDRRPPERYGTYAAR